MREALIKFLEVVGSSKRLPPEPKKPIVPYPVPPAEPMVMERGALRVDLSEPQFYTLTTADMYYLRQFMRA